MVTGRTDLTKRIAKNIDFAEAQNCQISSPHETTTLSRFHLVEYSINKKQTTTTKTMTSTQKNINNFDSLQSQNTAEYFEDGWMRLDGNENSFLFGESNAWCVATSLNDQQNIDVGKWNDTADIARIENVDSSLLGVEEANFIIEDLHLLEHASRNISGIHAALLEQTKSRLSEHQHPTVRCSPSTSPPVVPPRRNKNKRNHHCFARSPRLHSWQKPTLEQGSVGAASEESTLSDDSPLSFPPYMPITQMLTSSDTTFKVPRWCRALDEMSVCVDEHRRNKKRVRRTVSKIVKTFCNWTTKPFRRYQNPEEVYGLFEV
eukprot:scaffold918_cov126-Cylindrotheca_fusiformis.AAC.39